MFGLLKRLSKTLVNKLISVFLNGLFTILPLALTIGLFAFSFRLLKRWLEPITALTPDWLNVIPHGEIMVVIAAVFILGAILKTLILRQMVRLLEAIVAQIPLVRPVYFGLKQLVQAFSLQDTLTFKKVVLVEFPRKGVFSIGFLTGQVAKQLAPDQQKKFFNVFMPTTPNPTSGYYIMLAEESITVVDLTRQEAMALIISGGIIQPERFTD
ncbi:DUF502 domain-containing protein [bacterium]|jgi:uncharacterized membrane protein|nr:DUF502 domain-containing protein [bacterium]MBT3903428.1 DUF502 domain-containing protein [bacterium]MBT4577611.1 DUF502 domain-containing protein [bacterium]MBT5346147.1 DUF502 domain-containing protein [bacterium]MBT6131416.1 DUF502 domain-containing protein [bacterium]